VEWLLVVTLMGVGSVGVLALIVDGGMA